jgi:hypothetical protein
MSSVALRYACASSSAGMCRWSVVVFDDFLLTAVLVSQAFARSGCELSNSTGVASRQRA